MNAPVTRFFYDTEFLEDGRTIDLLSFGMVCDTSTNEFYHVNADADWKAAFENDWIRTNVMGSIKHEIFVPGRSDREAGAKVEVELTEGYPVALSKKSLALELINYVETNTPENSVPEFWAYYGDYDHVSMAQLFGRMIDLPAFFPMFTMDIKQLMVMKGVSRTPIEQKLEHNALGDARWNRDVFRYLISNDIPIQEEWM